MHVPEKTVSLFRSWFAATICILFGLAAGYLAASHLKAALILFGAGAVVGLFAVSPISIALLCLPSVFYTGRLSIGSGIALPDILLLIATVMSLPALARLGTPRGVSNVRRWMLVYVIAMLVSLAAHPSAKGLIEVGHRTLLVSGALGVGAWVYQGGKTSTALRLLVLGGVVVGVLCIFAGAVHGFARPAQPIGLNKNYAGSILGLTILAGLGAPDELGLPQLLRNSALVVLGGGLAATHSRGAMLALVGGVLVLFFRTHTDYRRRSFRMGAVVAIAFLVLGGVLVKDQLANVQATKSTNSVAVRSQVEAEARSLWHTSPIVGVGVYYYELPSYQALSHWVQAPTNEIDEALAEGGIVLLVGFLVFHVGAAAALFRRMNPLAVTGLAMVADRFIHGMADIYWTAGNASLPWIIAGMGLAQAAALNRSSDDGLRPTTTVSQTSD